MTKQKTYEHQHLRYILLLSINQFVLEQQQQQPQKVTNYIFIFNFIIYFYLARKCYKIFLYLRM